MNAIRVIGAAFAVFLYFMMIIIVNVRKTSESEFSILLRILTNYAQLLTSAMSFSSNFPNAIGDALLPVNSIGDSSEAFMSFDCFIRDSEVTGPFPSTALFKLFLVFFLPLILFLLVSLIWVLVYFLKRKWVRDLQRNIAISFISIIFLLHPKMALEGFSIFR